MAGSPCKGRWVTPPSAKRLCFNEGGDGSDSAATAAAAANMSGATNDDADEDSEKPDAETPGAAETSAALERGSGEEQTRRDQQSKGRHWTSWATEHHERVSRGGLPRHDRHDHKTLMLFIAIWQHI